MHWARPYAGTPRASSLGVPASAHERLRGKAARALLGQLPPVDRRPSGASAAPRCVAPKHRRLTPLLRTSRSSRQASSRARIRDLESKRRREVSRLARPSGVAATKPHGRPPPARSRARASCPRSQTSSMPTSSRAGTSRRSSSRSRPGRGDTSFTIATRRQTRGPPMRLMSCLLPTDRMRSRRPQVSAPDRRKSNTSSGTGIGPRYASRASPAVSRLPPHRWLSQVTIYRRRLACTGHDRTQGHRGRVPSVSLRERTRGSEGRPLARCSDSYPRSTAVQVVQAPRLAAWRRSIGGSRRSCRPRDPVAKRPRERASEISRASTAARSRGSLG